MMNMWMYLNFNRITQQSKNNLILKYDTFEILKNQAIKQSSNTIPRHNLKKCIWQNTNNTDKISNKTIRILIHI